MEWGTAHIARSRYHVAAHSKVSNMECCALAVYIATPLRAVFGI